MKRISAKLFESMLDDAYSTEDWTLVREALEDENKENKLKDSKNRKYPLANISTVYLSDIAHDRIMEDISYEDYLSEDEKEVYRLSLGIE